jgi:phosphate:Na+ symporter
MISASRQTPAGQRVALGSLLFKLAGCALVLPWVDAVADWMDNWELSAAEVVIGFHVLYNLVRCVLFLPLTQPMARFCTAFLPDRPQAETTMNPRHLDPSMLDTPALALANAAREALRMGDIVERMLSELMELIKGGTKAQGREVRRLDDDVDALYTAIKLYLARIPREELGERDSRRWAQIIDLAINLEQAGDIIERMASDLENKKISPNRSFSEPGQEELAALHGYLIANLRLCLSVFLSSDADSARRLRRAKQRFRVLERRYAHAHVERLHHQVVQSIETSSLHLGLLADMKRLNSLFCSIAYAVIEQADAGYETEHAASMETPPDLRES